MFDIKLLLSIVDQIKLPKDCYFAIRRSFYMVQSSFNSDQHYINALSQDTARKCVANKPLSVQKLPSTKRPSLSLISGNVVLNGLGFGQHHHRSAATGEQSNAANKSLAQSNRRLMAAASCVASFNNSTLYNGLLSGPRVCISQNRTKLCVQSLGKLGRSHLRLLDTQSRLNERSLMSPMRNCLVVGISNCGKNIILVRRSSRRQFRKYSEQDLIFHVHELNAELFDGFYLEDANLMFVVTHKAELLKIDLSSLETSPKDLSSIGPQQQKQPKRHHYLNEYYNIETLLLRDVCATGSSTNFNTGNRINLAGGCASTLCDDNTKPALNRPQQQDQAAKIKLRLASIDPLTNLMWIYLECEDTFDGSIHSSINNNNNSRRALFTRRSNEIGGCLEHSEAAVMYTDAAVVTSPDCYTINNKARRLSLATASALMRFRRGYNPFGNIADENDDEGNSCNDNSNGLDLSNDEIGEQTNDKSSSSARSSPDNRLAVEKVIVRKNRKIMMIDLITFDVFAAFVLQPNFGDIIQLRASLVAFCQLSNPMSNQFSSRIVQISPLGRFEQMLSFSDVVDYMVKVSETFINRVAQQDCDDKEGAIRLAEDVSNMHGHRESEESEDQSAGSDSKYLYSSLRRLLNTAQTSLLSNNTAPNSEDKGNKLDTGTSSSLRRYCRSLIRSQSVGWTSSGNSHDNENPSAGTINSNHSNDNSSTPSSQSTKSTKSTTTTDRSELP